MKWSSLFPLYALLISSQRHEHSHGIVNALASMPPLTENFSSKMAEHMPVANRAMKYLDSSPDPFHCVQTSIGILEDAGFQELKEGKPFKGKIEKGGKYYYTRNRSTLVAFSVGQEYEPGNGFKIIGGHSDSPNLKVKPFSKREGSGCIQLAVECYGGGLWHTWFDRDLGISGRVFVRSHGNGSGGGIDQKLVKVDRPILRIPNLAIHLQSASEREAFKVNKEDHLVPILASKAKKALTNGSIDDETSTNTGDSNGNDDDDDHDETRDEEDPWQKHQEPILLQIIALELGVDVKDIVDFELNLFDTQKAAVGGAYSEYIHSARLDNLASCFMAVEALADYSSEIENDGDISMIALFDHEEVGSSSQSGAGSPIINDAVKRIASALLSSSTLDSSSSTLENDDDLFAATKHKSLVLSVDQAHAIHPNYASKHEKGHTPKMNDGMVIKRNNNQRYATNGVTGLLIKEVAKKSGLPPIQEFVVRNDCPCGSTIGPIISTATGIRAIDMGCPQLSMHSIRETMGVSDLTNGISLFKGFYRHFREVDNALSD